MLSHSTFKETKLCPECLTPVILEFAIDEMGTPEAELVFFGSTECPECGHDCSKDE